MKQGFRFRNHVEISDFAPEQEVGNKCRPGNCVPAELSQFTGQQACPTKCKASGQHNSQGWNNSSHAPGIKIQEGEPPLFETLEDNSGNQETGYDKKYVNPDKATRQFFGKSMKKTTDRTATARSPSISGRYPGCSGNLWVAFIEVLFRSCPSLPYSPLGNLLLSSSTFRSIWLRM